MFQGGSDEAYGFVEFADHVGASIAQGTLDQRIFLNKVSLRWSNVVYLLRIEDSLHFTMCSMSIYYICILYILCI